MLDQDERTKVAVDCAKHITTLTTGTILLIVAGVDKLSKPIVGAGAGWLILSTGCFFVCLMFAFNYVVDVGILGEKYVTFKIRAMIIGLSYLFEVGFIVIFGLSTALR